MYRDVASCSVEYPMESSQDLMYADAAKRARARKQQRAEVLRTNASSILIPSSDPAILPTPMLAHPICNAGASGKRRGQPCISAAGTQLSECSNVRTSKLLHSVVGGGSSVLDVVGDLTFG